MTNRSRRFRRTRFHCGLFSARLIIVRVAVAILVGIFPSSPNVPTPPPFFFGLLHPSLAMLFCEQGAEGMNDTRNGPADGRMKHKVCSPSEAVVRPGQWKVCSCGETQYSLLLPPIWRQMGKGRTAAPTHSHFLLGSTMAPDNLAPSHIGSHLRYTNSITPGALSNRDLSFSSTAIAYAFSAHHLPSTRFVTVDSLYDCLLLSSPAVRWMFPPIAHASGCLIQPT